MRKTINNINEKERKKITNFLKINDNEIAVPVSQLPWGIEWTINLISEKWKIIISEKWNEIIWILLMTFWEPSKNFTNIEIGYLYLAIFNKDNRWSKEMLSWVFQKIIEETSKKWIKIIRFKADAAEKNTNKLYSKFANLIWHEKNTQWIECNLYEVEVDKLKTSFFDNGEFRPLLKS
jgi:hypothetical protein